MTILALEDDFPDGLDALRSVMSVLDIMLLIEKTARWVHPETFRYLPVWYPEYARKSLLYNGNWAEPRMNKNRLSGQTVHKFEGNTTANKALTLALGLRSDERPNWSCCHIWGVDDAAFQQSNTVVQDHRFFSCVGNMVLLPTPLKAFTDVMLEVKMMLRVCAAHLYGWICDDISVDSVAQNVRNWSDWSSYPQTWPKPDRQSIPFGTAPFSARVKAAADRRKVAIGNDLANAGQFYPREAVLTALRHWGVAV